MRDILEQLFSPIQYIPHSYCYLWQSQLVWLHIVSDLLIAIAYFSIPVTLVYFIYKRRDVPFLGVFGLFGAYIVLCGTGHLLEIWTLWHPAYWLTGIEKAMTALVSCCTALAMVTLLPQFLALQSPARLAAATEELETRINKATEGLRQRTTELVKANAALETEIQERTVAGKALRANQDFLKKVLNSVTDPIFVKDPHHRWTMVNDSFCQMVGVSREELLGRTDYDFFPKAEADVFWEYDNQVFTTGNEYENEEALTDGSGKLRVVSTKKIVFTDASGSQALVGIIRDITKRKQVEEARQHIAERERAISNIIQQMRQTLHLETIFSATTQELQHFLSCDRVVIYRFNSDWSGEFVSESVVLGWISLLQTQIQTNKSAMSEETVDEADCVVKTLACVDNPLQDTDTYLQETQGGVYSQGTTYISVPDVHKAGFQSCYLERLERIQAKAYITVPIFCGKQLWGLLAAYQNSAPRQWEEPEIKMMVQIGTQLGVAVQQAELLARTQRQAEELQQAKETADAANRAKSEFLANMSHELRTPLNAILGFTQVMQRDSSLSTEQQQYLNIVGCSGEHLLGMINDVLEMAKIEAGRATLHENSFNFHHLLGGVRELLQMGANSKGLQLNFECSDAVPQYIKTDANKLRQVLINLLSNAIKFTQIGSVTLRVSKQPTTDNKQLTIHFEVEDTGQGIAPSELNNLFEPFTQTETGLKHSEGSGLGLPISQQFVQLMGGEIAVSSIPDQGSQFTFDIQVSPVEAIPTEATQPICKKVMGLAPNQPTYRILVAEDKLTNRLLLAKLLSSFGFEVREAENGQEAIDIWESWEPHLIWMDMRMPVMNGYEATKHIKASLKGQATVIIALTASAFDEQRQAILLAGCDDFMHKPFREENLLKKINQHLGVQYIYEEKDEVRSQKDEQQNSTSYILSSSSLKIMPAKWVKQLHHAAAQGSDLLIYQLLEQIPKEDRSLSAALTDLVENFRFDSVMELAQPSEN